MGEIIILEFFFFLVFFAWLSLALGILASVRAHDFFSPQLSEGIDESRFLGCGGTRSTESWACIVEPGVRKFYSQSISYRFRGVLYFDRLASRKRFELRSLTLLIGRSLSVEDARDNLSGR